MIDGNPQAAVADRLAGLARPRRNRVTPAGELIATAQRGTMYGNRGVLHDDDLTVIRRYQVRRWLVHGGFLYRWTPAGYTDRIGRSDGSADVLTPRATVTTIQAGYRPLLHPSAG